MHAALEKPENSEYPEYFAPYIGRITAEDFDSIFTAQPTQLTELLRDEPGQNNVSQNNAGQEDISQHNGRYTWTFKQVVGHLIDSERIFSTRVLRLAVGDPAESPNFDQNEYVDGLNYDDVGMAELLAEFTGLRKANCLLFHRMSTATLQKTGIVAGERISVRAILFILCGHTDYHIEILQQRIAGLT